MKILNDMADNNLNGEPIPFSPALEVVTGNDHFTASVGIILAGKDTSLDLFEDQEKIELKDDVFHLFGTSDPQSKELQINILNDNKKTSKPVPYFESSILASSDDSYAKNIILKYLAGKPDAKNFRLLEFDPGFNASAEENNNQPANIKEKGITIRLGKDFLHQVFPTVYALTMKQKRPKLPNPPYTPVIEAISLDYTAKEHVSFDSSSPEMTGKGKLQDYAARKIQLFHEHPFGQAQQHPFLKDYSSSNKINLLPAFNSEGELFIGLVNAKPFSIVSLLFQVAEGSENPDSTTFTGKEKIQWHCLCNNEWKSLNDNFVLGDTTQKFLRSGIVKILLPEEINASNTILGEGKFWLRASLPGKVHPDAVCRIIDIKTQAVVAECSSGNDQSGEPLPQGTVTRIIPKPAPLRLLAQPFNSFGGRPAETENEYFRRISERIRHRRRAITIWDYEHLILEKFPSVYKVRCLNHTCTSCGLSPGNVTVVVIPNTRNKNSFDPLRPRVSQNQLNEIEAFLQDLNSLHVTFKAENPKYEMARVSFKVKFYDQYDPNQYKKKLNEDIIKYLSPWAFDEKAEIKFGGSIYKSVLVRFIEELEYVDFISDFKLFREEDNTDRPAIACSDARAILVSHKEHIIDLLTNEDICP